MYGFSAGNYGMTWSSAEKLHATKVGVAESNGYESGSEVNNEGKIFNYRIDGSTE